MHPSVIRTLSYLPVVAVATTIAVLSLWEHPTLPDRLMAWSDKTLHMLMYVVFGAVVMIAPYVQQHRKAWHYIAAWGSSVAYGGLMEILQATCTTSRTGDWADVAANIVGSSIGILLFYGAVRILPVLIRS